MAALIQVGAHIPAAYILGHMVHTPTLTRPCGQGSPEHAAIADSLADVLARVLQLGGRIMRDGREDELCLLGDSFITYGVVFFPKRDGDQRDSLLGEWSVHS